MSDFSIQWPDEMVEQVRAAKGRVERAGDFLRTMSIEERLQIAADVIEDWTAPDSPWRRALTLDFSEASSFHEGTVREGLDSALRAWKRQDLIECTRRELAPVLSSNSLHLSPFAWTAVLAGGGIPMPTLHSALLPLILGSPVLMREASCDRVTAPLFKRSLEARSEEFARAFESISFPSDDIALDELLSAPCIVATGSDETIRSIGSRLTPKQRFVAYGHQFSLGILGSHLGAEGSSSQEAALLPIAEAFALDIARWDQTGCLSPISIYLVDQSSAEAERFAGLLAEALERLRPRMPRGKVPTSILASHANERAEARMRQASGRSMLFEGSDSTVVLETNDAPRPAPLYRFIRLLPVDSVEALSKSLRPFAGQLSSVAVAGLLATEADDLRESLAGLGVSRITSPGRLQAPPVDWPHDGMPILTPLARFIQAK